MKTLEETIDAIHSLNNETVLTITGGGTEAFALLLKRGGGSKTLLEGVINYAPESTHDMLKYEPEHYASKETALGLAMVAYKRAVALGANDAHGIAATAKLAKTDAENRMGRTREIHVAYQNGSESHVTSLVFHGGIDREKEEETCALVIIHEMARWYGVKEPYKLCPSSTTRERSGAVAQASRGMISSEPFQCFQTLVGTTGNPGDSLTIFPGSFNPLHKQHLEMAKIGHGITGEKVWLEICANNTDKPALNFIDLSIRLSNIRKAVREADAYDYIAGILISNRGLFVQKALMNPGSIFLVGMDTYNRMGDEKYYSNGIREMAKKLADNRAQLLVFPRKGVKTRYSVLRYVSEIITTYVDDGTSSSEIRSNNE